MTRKLTFKEYWESKHQLISAASKTPKTQTEYHLRKYCKVPVLENDGSDEGNFISFKPNDKIIIFWEHHDLLNPTVTKFLVIDDSDNKIEYSLRWNDKKIGSWVQKNTRFINPYD